MQVNKHIYAEVLGRPRFADALVAELARAGARAVFGMAAESVNPLVDAVRRHPGVRFVPVRHEGAGALMASAYAKVSGRLGVCAGTAGPGATHLALGAYDARADRAPFLALTGQVPAEQLGLRTFQEVDSPALFDGAVLRNHTVTVPAQTPLLRQVVRESLLLRGPSHLALCSTTLTAPVTGRRPAPTALPRPARADDKAAVSAAGARLAEAGFCVLVASVDAPVPALWKLAERADCPVLVTPQGHRCVPERGEANGEGREAGGRLVRVLERNRDGVAEALRSAPAVLVLGSLTETARGLVGDHPRVVHIGPPEESPTPKPAGWLRVLGELEDLLTGVAERIGTEASGTGAAGAKAVGAEAMGALPRLLGAPPAHRPVWDALDAALPDDAVITLESGVLLDEAFTALRPAGRLLCASFALGARGYALPAAIGAALAAPRRPVVAVTDALLIEDFAAELTTLAALDLPVTVVCLDAPGGVDIDRMARAVGLRSVRAGGPEEAAEVLRSAGGGALVLSLPAGAHAGDARSGNAPAPTLVPAPESDPAPVTELTPVTAAATGTAPGPDTVGGHVARLLAAAGAQRAYRSRGHGSAAMAEALRAAGLTVSTARHTESPAMMASADAKFSRAPGVAVVASAAELLLQVNGAYDAAYDHAALVVVAVGAAPGPVDGRRLFGGFARAHRVDGAEALAGAARLVAETAESGGVCLLEITAEAFAEPLGKGLGLGEDHGTAAVTLPAIEPPPVLVPPRDALAAAAGRLIGARRPAILAGRGAQGSGHLVEALAELLQAPIVTTMPGRDAVDGSHPHYVGGIGSSGHRSADSTLRGCDVLLSLGVSARGSSAFDMPGDFAMVQVDSDLTALGASDRVAVALHGSVRPTLEELVALVSAARTGARTDTGTGTRTGMGARTDTSAGARTGAGTGTGTRARFLRERQEEYAAWFRRTTSLPYPRTGSVEQSAVPLAVLDEFGERDPYVVTVDVGLVTFWMYRYLRGRQRFVWTSSFATMGFALPAALAVAPLSGGRPVIAAVGDGGLAITMSELGTLAATEDHVVVLVFNNRRLGAVRFEQEIMGWPEDSCALHNGDIAETARAWGVRAHRAATPEELTGALRRAHAEPGPHLIEVVCEPDEVPALGQRGRTATQTVAFLVALARERRQRGQRGERGRGARPKGDRTTALAPDATRTATAPAAATAAPTPGPAAG
ncbi:thiamine pyrophosphate-dependent enzyme, partial [Streptomyces sp. URMC 123]|uniref:thiamine pyrophosphate-dependent enzyme n=1 Tax=Streptomyces sp. URMC 123 TaxID=3423403 RepID=UPI003F19FAE2